MAKPFVDISVLGDKELERALRALPDKSETKAVRPALRASAKRCKTYVVQHLSGFPVAPDTGRYLTGMVGQRIHALLKGQKARGEIGAGFDMPTRALLGIDPKDEWYYPAVLEYGSEKDPARYPPRAPIRVAVNKNQSRELGTIGSDIGKGIVRQWARLAKAK